MNQDVIDHIQLQINDTQAEIDKLRMSFPGPTAAADMIIFDQIEHLTNYIIVQKNFLEELKKKS